MLRLLDIHLHRMTLRTRMPFRYGIAELKELPHLFLSLAVEIDGQRSDGIAADHLPPRWFTKDTSQSPEQEIAAMLDVVRHAAINAIDSTAASPFDWWRVAYESQMAWAESRSIPPLLAHFGLTLVERALLDAYCHAHRSTFHQLLLSGHLGFTPERLYPELAGFDWRAAFPAAPRPSVFLRHTVGLSDPIQESDIPAGGHLHDGLPQSLEASILAYGLRHFKIKLCGDLDVDLPRLAATLGCIEASAPSTFAFSLDGNESYPDFDAFHHQWLALSKLPELRRHAQRLLFVEQPVRRDVALEPSSGPKLHKLAQTPIIIDESDGCVENLPDALDLGYAGTSHKNCKGVFKGLAAKCLLAARQENRSSSLPPLRQSGEDLCNIGPVALLQDLTVMASLGIASVERNGHHYFAGLQAFSPELNREVADTLPSLYQRDPNGSARLLVDGGKLDLGELLNAPFGIHFPNVLTGSESIPLPSGRAGS